MTEQQSWSIIVFAYNEEGNILNTLTKTIDVLDIISPHNYEIIIVDDGSTDNTRALITDFVKNKKNIITVFHKKNKGIGSAILSGYKMAKEENVCAIPADGQFNPEELIPFANVPPHTIISFYRKQKKLYSPFRKLLTLFNRILNRYVLGIKIKDVNWVKIYKNKNLKNTNLAITSSLVESEICAKMLMNNKELIEVESNYGIRLYGKPKGASFKTIRKAVFDVFILCLEIKRYEKNKIIKNINT